MFLRRSRPLHLDERVVLAGGVAVRKYIIFLSVKNTGNYMKVYIIFAPQRDLVSQVAP